MSNFAAFSNDLALVSAPQPAEGATGGTNDGKVLLDKKPRLYLLVTNLSPALEENHMQQILEQCGEVHAWRRARDTGGQALSFGFAQFGDPEAAWRASACLTKRMLCGQELKVLLEERSEVLISKWRDSQMAALKVNTQEELEWELERKSVSCKVLIDAKVEELYGPQEGSAGQATAEAKAQRHKELRDREQARVERTRKRKEWRHSEFATLLDAIEEKNKRLRAVEQEKDAADRRKEEADKKEQEQELADQNLSSGPRVEHAAPLSLTDNRQLVEVVDRVQAEARDELFKVPIDIDYLRAEKIFETKLRPWLERKVDFYMGGPQSDLVEYVLRRVNASTAPDSLVSDLSRYLDDNAELLVERMWRMLVFELLVNNNSQVAAAFAKDKNATAVVSVTPA